MNFDRGRAIADAVLMEGYALYPYRASAPKNRYRWTFGVLAPRAWSEAGGCEPWWLEAQVAVTARTSRVAGRLRFFQIARSASWDEGVLRTIDFDVEDGGTRVPFAFDGDAPVVGCIVLHRERAGAFERIAIRVENDTPWRDVDAPRDRVLIAAFASTHLLIGVDDGAIASAIDPPPGAPACTSVRTHPVLLERDLALAAPFILYDHPQLAPESAGDLCDASEIDELLMLRTRTLTDAEKREARATDARTAAIVDRADALSDERLAGMHGARRGLRAGEMVPLRVGTKVRLRAPARRTDAQDLLYAGHVATIVEVREDVDGTTFFGVTIDDDPAAEFHQWYGRYHYYRADEVDPL